MSHSEAPAPKTPEEFRAYLTSQAQQLLLPFGVTEEEIAPAVVDLMKDLQPQVGRVAANLYLRKESDAFDLVFNVDAKNGKDGLFRCSNQYNTGAWATLEVMRGAAELLSIAGKNIDTMNKRISELEEELRLLRQQALVEEIRAGNWVFQLAELNGGMKEMMLRLFSGVARGWDDPGSKERRALRDLGVVVDHV